MTVSAIVKNSDYGTLKVIDGAGSPATFTSTWTQGGLAIANLAKLLNVIQRIQVRGRHKCSIPGERKYPQFSFSCFLPNVVDGANNGTGTELEAILGVGALAARVNTNGANAPIFACTLQWVIEGTNVGDGTDETVTCTKVEIDDFQLQEADDGNIVSFTGTICGTVAVANGSSGTANTVTFAELS